MFYRSAADNKLASLEARISRLENRISKRAYGEEMGADPQFTIHALSQMVVRLRNDLKVGNLSQQVEGLAIAYDGGGIMGTSVKLSMIRAISPTEIQITLTKSGALESRFPYEMPRTHTFTTEWWTGKEIHVRELAKEIVNEAKVFDFMGAR
jgi:hypothetical protein